MPMRRIPLEQRARFNLLFFLQHYFRSSPRVARWKEEARSRIADSVRAEGAARVIPVERARGLSPEEFRERHLLPGVPVILEGAASDWTCTKEWSFESFKQRFGADTIRLIDRKGLTDDDYVRDEEYSVEVNFGEFLDQAVAGTGKYMRFSPLLEKFPELLDDFDADTFDGLMNSRFGAVHHAFIGGPRSTTPLHNAMSAFFFVNICGVKHWSLVPNHFMSILNPATDGFGYNHSGARIEEPDLEAFPGFDCIDRYETVMKPADVLFVPAWMWHSVYNESATIGLRYGMFHPRSMVGQSMTLFFVRLLAARNPTALEALYYSFVKTTAAERDHDVAIARMFRR